MIEIRITADSYSELNKDLQALLGFTKLTETVSAPVVSQQVASAGPSKTIENNTVETRSPAPQTKRKTKKKAASKKASPPTQEESEETEDVAEKQTSSFTAEDTYKKLQQVSSSCGLPKARELLSEFQADRISALQEKDFGAFIAACDQAIASA